ncbi:unnamed protein product [Mytilus coruscus]|uniref:DZIP3-like HEPN domain-containing protein n=1 Tax=Mytilus coruscus TaxID=42192 RepID=A0A6J8DIJ5_MYTCO|nr:unnamed protein product [Mytilus coruscus]
MASYSSEEENYARLNLLLAGISSRAVRKLFDSQFPPVSLAASLMKENNKLRELKKKNTINQAQWYLLFPPVRNVVGSKTFDISLMITLLSNLANLSPPHGGLPPVTDTTQGADLGRFKYYRNYLAHLDDEKVISTVFDTAWDKIAGAIERLGGPQMKQECDHLKSKALDQTNQQIMMDIKHSRDEITELKKSVNTLALNSVEIKEMMDDIVPRNIRGIN